MTGSASMSPSREGGAVLDQTAHSLVSGRPTRGHHEMDTTRLSASLLTSPPVDRRAVDLLRAMTSGEGRASLATAATSARYSKSTDTGGAPGKRADDEAFDWLAHHGLVARESAQLGLGGPGTDEHDRGPLAHRGGRVQEDVWALLGVLPPHEDDA